MVLSEAPTWANFEELGVTIRGRTNFLSRSSTRSLGLDDAQALAGEHEQGSTTDTPGEVELPERASSARDTRKPRRPAQPHATRTETDSAIAPTESPWQPEVPASPRGTNPLASRLLSNPAGPLGRTPV